MNYPLISIGVSAYNRKDYLRLCLNSLLGQSYPACEIIVVDDGSTDGTKDMMAAEFPQVRYICQENAGDAAAKNHAAREAKGEYIIFNDSDDLFLPDTVERLFAAMPQGETACTYGTYQTIDAEGRKVPTKRKAAVYPSGMITGELLSHVLVNSTGVLFPRKLYLDNGGFDTSLRVAHDYDLFLKLSLQCPFYAVQEPVFLRRRHGGNLSAGSYSKMLIMADVFENFVAAHPELQKDFSKVIRRRQADMQNKLRREALKENMREKAREHAANAFRLAPGLKTFFRKLFA